MNVKRNRDLIEKYYRDNPKKEVAHRRSEILEFGLPPALGAVAGAVSGKGILANPRSGAGIGFTLSIPLAAVQRAHRRKKILKEMGVEESVLGSFMEPIKMEI